VVDVFAGTPLVDEAVGAGAAALVEADDAGAAMAVTSAPALLMVNGPGAAAAQEATAAATSAAPALAMPPSDNIRTADIQAALPPGLRPLTPPFTLAPPSDRPGPPST
jgi:hypothetical protein